MKSTALFWGTSEFAVPILQALHSSINILAVITQPGAPRNGKMTNSPVAEAATSMGISCLIPNTLKDDPTLQKIFSQPIDVCLLAAYGKIIPASLLRAPKHGWINVHPSLLPCYRGPSPLQQAILDGQTSSGVTFIIMDEGVDTGPILGQYQCTVDNRETTPSLTDKLSHVASRHLPELLEKYLNGGIQPKPQPSTDISLTKKITKEMGHIDWSRSATHIDRQIRAFSPWPGAYAYLGDVRLAIKEAAPLEQRNIDSRTAPGTVCQLSTKTIAIVCGDDSLLELQTVQRSGKAAMSTKQFLLGFPSLIGKRLT